MLGKIVEDGVLDIPRMELSKYGKITEKHIVAISTHYEYIAIPKYVIMPNHLHMLISILNDYAKERGTSRTPSPTNAIIPSLISTLKRFVHKECGFSLFQRGSNDIIVRNEEAYNNIAQYIDENPVRWKKDRYYI